jgi:glycosyltransferase involved in cell wall biosynthesis
MKQCCKSVAFITNGAYSLPNFRGPLMSAMIRDGWKVFGLAPDHDQYTRDRLSGMGVIPVDIPMDPAGMNPMRDVANMIKLAGLLRRMKPDLVLGFFVKPVIFGSIAAFLARIPRRYCMIEGLGHAFASSGLEPSIKQTVLRLIVKLLLSIGFKACHGVIFLNDDDRSEFTDSSFLSMSKTLRTKGIGVDLEAYPQLPWAEGGIVFLLAARLLRSKGIVEFAEAAKLVRAEHPEAHFILLGGIDSNPDGLSLMEVEALAEEAGIEWPGHVNEVLPYLARCHVFVLPSYYREGIPRSLQEALACGRAVITTDNVGCRETVVDGLNGYLVPVRDSTALADAMLRFARTPARAQTFGSEGRAFAKREFDVTKINAEIMNFISR